MSTTADAQKESLPARPAGRCWGCGYLLVGIVSRRCPDCGRRFDPADPATINRRRAIGPVGRVALAGPGWLGAGLAALGAALVVWGTGWPGESALRFEDWPLLRQWLVPRGRELDLTPRWSAYASGVLVAAAALAWLAVRWAARRLMVLRYRPPADMRPRFGRPATVTALLLLVCLYWIAAGGARRIGREWAHAELARARTWAPPATPPVELAPGRRLRVIRVLLLHGDDAVQRRAGLKLLVEREIDHGLPVLHEAAERERDPELLALELRLIGMYREEQSAALLDRFARDARPAVRAAAADALGLLHQPAYRVGGNRTGQVPGPAEVPGKPLINLGGLTMRGRKRLVNAYRDPWAEYPFYARQVPMPADRRGQLLRMMLDGPTLEEREAAARALLPQPTPGYRLRLAEWGVWLDEDGDLKTARAISDEVPGFVHRTANPLAEMAPRIQQVMMITKPIVHLAASDSMAVDLEVRIRDGRPWFAYPMPDDLEVVAETKYNPWRMRGPPLTRPVVPPHFLKPLDQPELGSLPLANLRSGYPWMEPRHRMSGPIGGKGNPINDIVQMGVHWQSVIVSPIKLPWMKEPEVGADPKHAWWRRLREVECSWVSSRGESERFLYYDGPTRMKMPHRMTLENDVLRLTQNEMAEDEQALGAMGLTPQERRQMRERGVAGDANLWRMVVRVEGGQVRGEVLAPEGTEWRLFQGGPDAAPLRQGQVEGRLRELLLERGLNAGEAAGLLDCWRKDFFEKPGARVLMVMPPHYYEAFCPLVVRPAPTEYVRVGIVVTELGGD